MKAGILSALRPKPAEPVAPPCAEENERLAAQAALAARQSRHRETTSMKIMLVDDEPYNIMVAQKFLEGAGYERFVSTTNASAALELIADEQPDVILLDVMMPHVSGLDILHALSVDRQWRNIPVIILTAASDAETKKTALELGATDFLSKPVDAHELVPRVRNALVIKANQDRLHQHAVRLEDEVARRTNELAASREEVILCLARAAEFRDNDTANHVIRVGRYVGVIARQLGMDERRIKLLEQAAQLHDVGKLGIPDAVLQKPGPLDPQEYELVKEHTKCGARIMQPLQQRELDVLRRHAEIGARILDQQSSPVLTTAALIALTHHERWDGTGYPLGLAGEDIPIEGRMTAVADVFDALASTRPYKAPFPREKCFEILREKSGSHFDPTVIEAFFAGSHDIVKIQIQYADLT